MLHPSNNLEILLHKAAGDESFVNEFYTQLVEASVFILGKPDGDIEGEFEFAENQSLTIQHWERDTDKSPVVPFFTSLPMLKSVISGEEDYLEIPTKVLLEMTMGVPLVLNPNTDYGMELDSEDVAALLETSLMMNQEHQLDADTEVILGHVEDEPFDVVDMLIKLFKDQDKIRAGYLGTIEVIGDDIGEHLMVGIEGKGNIQPIIDKAIKKLSIISNLPSDTIDFYVINQDDPDISDFFINEVEPFYSVKEDVVSTDSETLH